MQAPVNINSNSIIGVVFAMEAEARPFIEQMNLTMVERKHSIQIYENKQRRLYVSLNGKCRKTGVDHIGTNGAIINTYVLNEIINPDMIINAGTAGGFKQKGVEIGDVLACTSAIFHDRRIPLPLFEGYGIGRYPLAASSNLIKKLKLKQGIISTGNSLDFTQEELRFFEKEDVTLKDMEAAAIAWLCEEIEKPFIAIKSITDIVEEKSDAASEFEKNFKLAVGNLTSKLIELIAVLHN